MSLAREYRFWFRQKYNLPPKDSRFLAMTEAEIQTEFWACQFYKEIKKGRTPTVDFFDTDFVDDAMAKWAEEDDELIDLHSAKDQVKDWEEVMLND